MPEIKIFDELLNIFMNYILIGNYDYLYVLILLLLSILLFKEFKKNYLESNSYEDSQIIIHLDVYSRAYLAINRYQNKAIDNDTLCIALLDMLPNATDDMLKILFNANFSESELKELELLLTDKIRNAKYLKKQDLVKALSSNALDNLFYSIGKGRIRNILIPLVYTMVTVISLIMIVLTLINIRYFSSYDVFILFLVIFTFSFFMTIIISESEMVLDKNFPFNWRNTVLLVLVIPTPLLLQIDNIGVYLFTGCTILYTIYKFKRAAKQNNKNGRSKDEK
jgi:hypothetical protein